LCLISEPGIALLLSAHQMRATISSANGAAAWSSIQVLLRTYAALMYASCRGTATDAMCGDDRLT
jgi:hypothetical protein